MMIMSKIQKKSSAVLESKPSSVMGSESHHKVRDKNKDDNDVVDAKDS